MRAPVLEPLVKFSFVITNNVCLQSLIDAIKTQVRVSSCESVTDLHIWPTDRRGDPGRGDVTSVSRICLELNKSRTLLHMQRKGFLECVRGCLSVCVQACVRVHARLCTRACACVCVHGYVCMRAFACDPPSQLSPVGDVLKPGSQLQMKEPWVF